MISFLGLLSKPHIVMASVTVKVGADTTKIIGAAPAISGTTPAAPIPNPPTPVIVAATAAAAAIAAMLTFSMVWSACRPFEQQQKRAMKQFLFSFVFHTIYFLKKT